MNFIKCLVFFILVSVILSTLGCNNRKSGQKSEPAEDIEIQQEQKVDDEEAPVEIEPVVEEAILTIDLVDEAYFWYNRYYKTEEEFRESINDSSLKLNATGYSYYKEKDWENAKKYFLKAAVLDNTNGYAILNYACTLALEYGTSIAQQNLDEINEALKRAIVLNMCFAKKILNDSDFENLRHTYPSRRITGHNSIELDPTWELILEDNGTAQFTLQVAGGDGGMGNYEDEEYSAPPIEWAVNKGEYTIIGDVIYIHYFEKLPLYYDDYCVLYITEKSFAEHQETYRGKYD